MLRMRLQGRDDTINIDDCEFDTVSNGPIVFVHRIVSSTPAHQHTSLPS
jgi:hypothetical protein